MDPTVPTPSTKRAEEAEAIRVGKIVIYPDRYEVFVDRRRVELTLTQYRLLFAMAHRPGWVVSPDRFRDRLGQRPRQSLSANASLKHHVAALRRKLGVAGVQLQTVRGQGYRLVDARPDDQSLHHTPPDGRPTG